jgi:hypothetical protein
MSGEGKADALVTQERVSEMINALLKGTTRRIDLLRYFTEKWELGERSVEIYLAKAKAEILAMREEDRSYQKAEALAQINTAISLSFQDKDTRAALAGIKLKIDLQGLAEPARLHIDQTSKESLDRATVIEKLEQIAQTKGISMEELCKREGIDISKYQSGV